MGQIDGAAAFNGSNAYLQAADSPSLRVGSPAFTFEFWLNPSSSSGCSTYSCIVLNKEDSYEVALNSDGYLYWAINNSSPGWAWVGTGANPPLNAWTHVAITYDGSNVRSYQNGVLTNTTAATGSVNNTYQYALRTGARGAPGSPFAYFAGSLDNVTISNAARSAGWIATEYNNQSSPSGFYSVGAETQPSPLWISTVTPNSGSAGSQTFSVTAADANGAADLASVYLLIGAGATSNACYARYDRATNLVFLADNSGNFSSAGGAIGSQTYLQNSQCLLRADYSTVSASGNYLTVNFMAAFTAAFNGARTLYAQATNSGFTTGLMPEGTWTVAQPISIASLSPNSGSGNSPVFTITVTDTAGAQDLANLWFWFPPQNSQNYGCFGLYTASSNTLQLINDGWTGYLPAITPGSSASAANSQSTLYGSSSRVTLSGNTATITLGFAFTSAFTGLKTVYLYANNAATNSGWTDMGTWTATPPGPTLTSITPATGAQGAGVPVTLTGTNFISGAAINPGNAGINVSNVTVVSGSQITATFTIAAGASLGAGNVAVTTSSGTSGAQPFTVVAPTQVITTTPTGLSLTVDNTPCTTPCSFPWTPGVNHTVAAGALQSGATGVQYLFGSWSDSGAATHTVTSSANPVTLTATYTTQYYLTTTANPASEGSILPASEWVNAGTVVAVSALPTGNNVFAGFSGPLSGTASPQNLTVNAPATVTANFTPPPDFTITVTPTTSPATAMAGGSAATYTVSVAPVNGFAGTVTFTAGLPSGFTGSFASSSISGGSGQTTMYVSAPNGTASNVGISVTGSSGGLVHIASGGTLAVQDFMLVLSPGWSSTVSGLALPLNQSGYWTVAAQGLNGFNQPISLYETQYQAAPSVPTACNAFLGFSPNPQTQANYPGSVQPGQTVDVNITAASPAPQGYPPLCGVTISGSYGGTTHFATGVLMYTGGPDFTLIPPAPQTVGAGSSATFSLAYQPTTAVSWTMGISVTGLPQGATYSATPFPNGGNGATLTVNVPAGVTPGTYSLTVTANGVSPAGCSSGCTNATHSEIAILTVAQQGTDYSITVSPTLQTIQQGQSATFNVSLTPTGGFGGAVTLSVGSITGGVTASLSASTISAGSPATLTLTAQSAATLGAYRVTLQGSDSTGTINRFAVAPLLVTLGSPGPTIPLGSVSVPITGVPVIIAPPLPAGDSLTTAGCSPPPGTSVTVGTAPGNPGMQTLSIVATAQAGSNPTLSCITSFGRTLTARYEYGAQASATVSVSQESGTTFDVNVTTYGFSEVDSIELVGSGGAGTDYDVEEDDGDVSEDYTVNIPVGTCELYSAFVWGYAEGMDSGPAWAYALPASACDEYDSSASYIISGRVFASNGNPLMGVNITAVISGAPTEFSTTDASGYYSISVSYQPPSCPSVGVGASFGAPYTIPFSPSSGYIQCLQSNQTLNFTAAPFTTVYLVHGIGQRSTGVANLASNLMGVDTSRFYVDAGFDFGECAAEPSLSALYMCTTTAPTTSSGGTLGPLSCSVSNGAIKLADYILNVSRHNGGRAALVGYSMGGLLARAVLTYGNTAPYQYLLQFVGIAGLITLGTPNWGYGECPVDRRK